MIKKKKQRKLSDKQLDAILEAYAYKIKDKNGTEEEIFQNLKQEFANQKQNNTSPL